MKEFLEGLEALLIEHPDIEICGEWDDYRLHVQSKVEPYKCFTSDIAELTVADIQRFKRELGAGS